jgi:hypothetical protein
MINDNIGGAVEGLGGVIDGAIDFGGSIVSGIGGLFD